MSHRVVIRPCRREDLHALEWDGLFTHHREIVEQTFEEHLAGRQIMLVAEVDGTLPGQVWIDVATAAARKTGIIWALRVHPTRRRGRLGTRLMDEAEAAIRGKGFTAAELTVERTNAAAKRFYRRRGYTPTREVTHGYTYTTPDGEFFEHVVDLLEMRKPLEPADR